MDAELIALRTQGYYYLTPRDGDGSGSLLLETDTGDTLIPPYGGTYECFGATDTLADAQEWAAEVHEQRLAEISMHD